MPATIEESGEALSEREAAYQNRLKYSRFFFWSTILTVLLTASVVLFSMVGLVSLMPPFALGYPVALLIAVTVVIPAGIISLPVWYLFRKLLHAAGLGGMLSAVLASQPTLWFGVHVGMTVFGLLNDLRWRAFKQWNFFELHPFEPWIMAASSVIGPILAWKIYKDE